MPRRKTLTVLAAALGVVALVPIATALGDDADERRIEAATALTTTFTYQGRLTDAGSPANGTYDLRFILYDADSGGSQVGSTVTLDDVPVANGLFTVDLDFGANAFQGDVRWLEIAVRPGTSTGAYTVLSPRQSVSPAPYALFAATAGNLKVPLTISASSAGAVSSPEGLVTVNQSGTGIAIAGNRTTTDTAEFPAVLGTNAGGGAGVQGESTAPGGVGVRGIASNGTAGEFIGPTAITLDGAIKVSGSSPAAFQHRVVLSGASKTTCALTGNSVTYVTDPQVKDKANLMLFVTIAGMGTGSITENIAASYQSAEPTGCPEFQGAWAIYTGGGQDLPDGAVFNILAIEKP